MQYLGRKIFHKRACCNSGIQLQLNSVSLLEQLIQMFTNSDCAEVFDFIHGRHRDWKQLNSKIKRCGQEVKSRLTHKHRVLNFTVKGKLRRVNIWPRHFQYFFLVFLKLHKYNNTTKYCRLCLLQKTISVMSDPVICSISKCGTL